MVQFAFFSTFSCPAPPEYPPGKPGFLFDVYRYKESLINPYGA
jgi:hypothetical protein